MTLRPRPAPTARVGFVQMRARRADRDANLARAAALVDDAPDFDVLVLPELFSSGYLFLDRRELGGLAEGLDGPTATFLRERARARGGWLAGGFAERDGERIYNSAALAGPDGTVHVYRKLHLFDREREVFDPGEGPLRAWTIGVRGGAARVGVMICFDWFFPETARCLALDGAEVLLHPSNLVLAWCQDAMRTRCLENGVHAVTANRTGADETAGVRLEFTGRSQITGARGEVLARADARSDAVAVEEVDLERARDKRVTARNDRFADRRPDLYDRLRP